MAHTLLSMACHPVAQSTGGLGLDIAIIPLQVLCGQATVVLHVSFPPWIETEIPNVKRHWLRWIRWPWHHNDISYHEYLMSIHLDISGSLKPSEAMVSLHFPWFSPGFLPRFSRADLGSFRSFLPQPGTGSPHRPRAPEPGTAGLFSCPAQVKIRFP